MRMNDLNKMTIEQIIRLPFFYSLHKDMPNHKEYTFQAYWKITLKCNRVTATGQWELLGEVQDSEYIIRYKIIEFAA